MGICMSSGTEASISLPQVDAFQLGGVLMGAKYSIYSIMPGRTRWVLRLCFKELVPK